MKMEIPIKMEPLDAHVLRLFLGGTVFAFYCAYVLVHVLLEKIPGAVPVSSTREFRCQWKRNLICMVHSAFSFTLTVVYLSKYPDLITIPVNYFESEPLLLLTLNIGSSLFVLLILPRK
jgi:hypothetical protein